MIEVGFRLDDGLNQRGFNVIFLRCFCNQMIVFGDIRADFFVKEDALFSHKKRVFDACIAGYIGEVDNTLCILVFVNVCGGREGECRYYDPAYEDKNQVDLLMRHAETSSQETFWTAFYHEWYFYYRNPLNSRILLLTLDMGR